jgi:hypothetical protein
VNEERVAIINGAMQGRVTVSDATYILDALLQLEGEPGGTVEPPCKMPPWRRGTAGKEEMAAMMFAEDASGLLQNCHGQIVLGLEKGILDSACVCLAALDVLYLSRFWTDGRRVAITFGGVELTERAGILETGWFDVALAAGACQIAWDLFSQPFPIQAGVPGASSLEAVETPLGMFVDCLKVERQTENALTVWLARGVGPVRVTLERADGTGYTHDLTACSPPLPRDAESYFPRTPGRWWRFDSGDHTSLRRQIWRVLAHPQEGLCWLSFAGYVGKYDNERKG